jgi:hypothetical protein
MKQKQNTFTNFLTGKPFHIHDLEVSSHSLPNFLLCEENFPNFDSVFVYKTVFAYTCSFFNQVVTGPSTQIKLTEKVSLIWEKDIQWVLDIVLPRAKIRTDRWQRVGLFHTELRIIPSYISSLSFSTNQPSSKAFQHNYCTFIRAYWNIFVCTCPYMYGGTVHRRKISGHYTVDIPH